MHSHTQRNKYRQRCHFTRKKIMSLVLKTKELDNLISDERSTKIYSGSEIEFFRWRIFFSSISSHFLFFAFFYIFYIFYYKRLNFPTRRCAGPLLDYTLDFTRKGYTHAVAYYKLRREFDHIIYSLYHMPHGRWTFA